MRLLHCRLPLCLLFLVACSDRAAVDIAATDPAPSAPAENGTSPTPSPSSVDAAAPETDASPLPVDAGLCPGNPQKVPFEGACQPCLDAKCCGELKACFALKTSPDCNDYADCVRTCNG